MDFRIGEMIFGFGYYEIIVGGVGVGFGWVGESGVYVYMINICIIDFEIFEK